MLDIKGYPVFPGLGVLTKAGDPSFAKGVTGAFTTEGSIEIHFSDKSVENFASDAISVGKNTGRITFTTSGSDYTIRELRENDGNWISKYKTTLPLEAVEHIAEGGNVAESLVAYTQDDSVYILGVVYTNDLGKWSRIDGDWIMLSPDDDTFDEMIVLEIDMDQSTSFLEFYDNNFVSVTDAEKYEVADDSTAEAAPPVE